MNIHTKDLARVVGVMVDTKQYHTIEYLPDEESWLVTVPPSTKIVNIVAALGPSDYDANTNTLYTIGVNHD